MDTESVAMSIIAYSGEGRAKAFAALESAKLHDYLKAKELMKISEEALLLAHKAQTELLSLEARGDKINLNVLLVHSQDHLMTSMLAQELIKEIIRLEETKQDK